MPDGISHRSSSRGEDTDGESQSWVKTPDPYARRHLRGSRRSSSRGNAATSRRGETSLWGWWLGSDTRRSGRAAAHRVVVVPLSPALLPLPLPRVARVACHLAQRRRAQRERAQREHREVERACESNRRVVVRSGRLRTTASNRPSLRRARSSGVARRSSAARASALGAGRSRRARGASAEKEKRRREEEKKRRREEEKKRRRDEEKKRGA